MDKNYCRIYFVRHGLTDWNVLGKVQGHSDIPLNEEGKKQAKNLAKKLTNVNFYRVFSSDLIRAKQTAEIIALEKKLTVQVTKALRERCFGKLEGIEWKKNQKQLDLIWKKLKKLTDVDKKLLNLGEIEDNEQLMGRFIPFVRKVAISYPKKNILMVTHGGLLRAFLIHLGYGDDKTLPSGCIKNTAYIVIDTDGTDFFIKEVEGVEKVEVG